MCQQQEAEALDQIRTQCMLKAERKCRKLCIGMVDFSPEVVQPLREISFWDIAIKRRQEKITKTNISLCTQHVNAKLWKRKKHAAKIDYPTKHMSIDALFQA